MKTLARDRCRAEILQRLRTVRPDSVRLWGRMSAHQMVCHLSDACRMALGQMRVSPATGPLPQVVVKWIALYLPLRWPAGIVTRPEIDQQTAGTCPADFESDVAQLEVLLERVATHSQEAGWPEHPIFGKMSHRAWLRWAYLHADHHLRQFGA